MLAPIRVKPASGSHNNFADQFQCVENGTSEAVAAPVLMVRVAVAGLPNVGFTECGPTEHVGEPAWAGCTEHVSEMGFVKPFRRLTVTVEVAFWLPFSVLGLDGDAEREKSVPTFSSTLIVFPGGPTENLDVAIKSGAESPFRSATKAGVPLNPASKLSGFSNVPSPLPSEISIPPF